MSQATLSRLAIVFHNFTGGALEPRAVPLAAVEIFGEAAVVRVGGDDTDSDGGGDGGGGGGGSGDGGGGGGGGAEPGRVRKVSSIAAVRRLDAADEARGGPPRTASSVAAIRRLDALEQCGADDARRGSDGESGSDGGGGGGGGALSEIGDADAGVDVPAFTASTIRALREGRGTVTLHLAECAPESMRGRMVPLFLDRCRITVKESLSAILRQVRRYDVILV